MAAVHILIIVACLGLLVLALLRPFVGLFMLVLVHFTQPGEMISFLNTIRIELLYGLLVFGVFVYRVFTGRAAVLAKDPILKPLTWFMILVLFTVPGSFWPGGSVTAWTLLFKIAIFAYVMRLFVDSPGQLKSMLWLQVIILAWLCGSGYWAFTSGNTYHLTYNLGNIERAQGVNSIAGGPNELSGLLVALLPYLIALFKVVKNLFCRILFVAVGVLSLIVIVLAGSRIALISLILVGMVHVFTARRKVLSLAALAVLAIVVWRLMPPVFQQRYLTTATYAEGGQLDDSNQLRLRIWNAGWRMFLDHPLLGVGFGQFPTAYGSKYSGVAHGAWMNPHNLFLQVLCETGVMGVVFFGMFIWRIFQVNRRLLNSEGDDNELTRALAVACNATFWGVVGVSFVSHTVLRPYWYFLAGLVIANHVVWSSQAATGVERSSDAELKSLQSREPVPAV